MDPTGQSLILLISLALRTYERYQANEITDEQAKAIYDAACDRLNAAYDAFRQAGDATVAGQTPGP